MARQNTKRSRTRRAKHARKTAKTRLRALLRKGAASRPAAKADGRYFAGLREGIRRYRLEDLLKKAKKQTLHPEIDFGPPKGREVL